MGKIVVTEFVSLDGIFEDPGGAESYKHGGWSFQINRGDDGDKFKLDEALASDALLLGRVTYQGFADAWPSRTGEFADKFNSMPKYVVSTTLNTLEWNNSHLINGDVAREVPKLKEQFGGDVVVHGSGQLVNSLKEHDLVDEYRLMVFPVILGTGKRLFADGGDLVPLKLADTRQVGPDGVVILTYQRAGDR
ncbi:MAG TPA: dihydrofolate reductase family protein [Acidimicrobiia bacterium]|nr:dihydrofolate reductase family protein [Acidimicrobiia bacterium]